MRCETLSHLEAGRLVSPSAERNKGPVAEVLKQALPDRGLVLEIGSGTGQHVLHFAREAPHLTWQPSERDAECLQSIALWLAAERPANVLAPLRLDVREEPWPISSAAAVVSLNMIHIAPWDAGMALIRGAAAILEPGAVLFLYGPFRRGDKHTSPSNEAFDRQLRAQSPAWGVRDLEEVTRYATAHGFALPETYEMPANNLSVVLRKRESHPLTDRPNGRPTPA
jgi:SAM-dependent methyltransferase